MQSFVHLHELQEVRRLPPQSRERIARLLGARPFFSPIYLRLKILASFETFLSPV